MLLFDLIDEDSDGSIYLNQILKFLSTSFIQNVSANTKYEEALTKEFSGKDPISKKMAVDIFLTKASVKAILSEYLQIKSMPI